MHCLSRINDTQSIVIWLFNIVPHIGGILNDITTRMTEKINGTIEPNNLALYVYSAVSWHYMGELATRTLIQTLIIITIRVSVHAAEFIWLCISYNWLSLFQRYYTQWFQRARGWRATMCENDRVLGFESEPPGSSANQLTTITYTLSHSTIEWEFDGNISERIFTFSCLDGICL